MIMDKTKNPPNNWSASYPKGNQVVSMSTEHIKMMVSWLGKLK